MYRLLITLAVAMIALPQSAAAQCSDADRRALEAFDRAWTEASNRGDRAFLQNVYADDYTNLGIAVQQGKAQTIDDAVRQAEQNRANPAAVPKVTYSHYVIHCTPTTATVTHRNEITSTVGGREQTTYSRSVHNLEKRGGAGRWSATPATHLPTRPCCNTWSVTGTTPSSDATEIGSTATTRTT